MAAELIRHTEHGDCVAHCFMVVAWVSDISSRSVLGKWAATAAAAAAADNAAATTAAAAAADAAATIVAAVTAAAVATVASAIAAVEAKERCEEASRGGAAQSR